MPKQEPELFSSNVPFTVLGFKKNKVGSQVFSDTFFGSAQTFKKVFKYFVEVLGFDITKHGQVGRWRGPEVTDHQSSACIIKIICEDSCEVTELYDNPAIPGVIRHCPKLQNQLVCGRSLTT